MTLPDNPKAVMCVMVAIDGIRTNVPMDIKDASKIILAALDPIVAEAVARERERCAKACDGYFPSDFMPNDVARAIKHRIRETET